VSLLDDSEDSFKKPGQLSRDNADFLCGLKMGDMLKEDREAVD
jgi:hypothetical protein